MHLYNFFLISLLNLLNITDTETTFMLYEKGERKTTIKQQRKNIQEGIKKGVLIFLLGFFIFLLIIV